MPYCSYNKKRDEQWKSDAKAWMEAAASKLGELREGTDLLDQISKRINDTAAGRADRRSGGAS